MQLAGRDGVEVAPDVPSMLAELHRAAVAILPSSSGSGIKNKVLEAFAAGTPVVTNPAGIDGVVGAERGVHYLEADGPDALAEACAALLESADERVRLAAAARQLVEKDYSWDSRAEAMLELYGRGAAVSIRRSWWVDCRDHCQSPSGEAVGRTGEPVATKPVAGANRIDGVCLDP